MEVQLQKAKELGLDMKSTVDGALTSWHISIPDLSTYKQVLDAGTTYKSREARVAQLFEGLPPVGPAEEDGTAYGTTRRVERYLWGNDKLHPADAKRAAGQFPQTYTVTQGDPPNPVTGEYSIGTSLGQQNITWNTLVLADGGYITAYNTPVTLTITSLTRTGGPAPGFSDFNIFGVTGGVGGVGATVDPGTSGATGGGGTCTVSGSEPGDDGGTGSNGVTGATGNAGGTGGTGLASGTTQITITDYTGTAATLSVFSQSGCGGTGGTGGTGAAGGNGGNGGDGASCECTGTSGGRGG